MPPLPISEVPEVEQHHLAQAAIVAGVTASADNLWPVLDPTDLAATIPVVQRGLIALVDQFSQASISTAADYYEDLRALHVSGRYGVQVIDAPPTSRIQAMLRAIATPGLARTGASRDAFDMAETALAIQRGSLVAAQSLVADSASDQIFTALAQDERARGWARIARPGACYFCRMLASRGAVYYTQKTGSFRAHTPKDGRGGYCGCTVEPLFGRYYEPTAQAREDADTWHRVARDKTDSINQFRRAVEGRPDGPLRPRGRNTDPKAQKSPKSATRAHGFDSLTVAELRHQIKVFESLADSEWRNQQLDRRRNRLADLGA